MDWFDLKTVDSRFRGNDERARRSLVYNKTLTNKTNGTNETNRLPHHNLMLIIPMILLELSNPSTSLRRNWAPKERLNFSPTSLRPYVKPE